MTSDLTNQSPMFRMEHIYGVKKFIPPMYEIWKRNWFGKWTLIEKTLNPMSYANKPVVSYCREVGSAIGYDDLLEKFLKDCPHHACSEYSETK